MKDLFVVQKCLHIVNKSGHVRGGVKTFCEWYVDSAHEVSENYFHALFSPAQMGEVYHTEKHS